MVNWNWDAAGSGALGGAAAGWSIGGGPVGAIIGGLGGGLLGLFGHDDAKDQRDRLAAYEQYISGRPMQQLAPSGYEANRAAMIKYLTAMAHGNGPSVARNQMREAMDRAAGSQASLAAGAAGRGMSAGAAYRNAANNTAAIQSQGARDTANARVQEQLGALGQLQNAINTGIGQQNAFAIAQLDAYLRQQGMNDVQRLQILQLYQGQMRPSLGAQIGATGISMLPYAIGQNTEPATPAPATPAAPVPTVPGGPPGLTPPGGAR